MEGYRYNRRGRPLCSRAGQVSGAAAMEKEGVGFAITVGEHIRTQTARNSVLTLICRQAKEFDGLVAREPWKSYITNFSLIEFA